MIEGLITDIRNKLKKNWEEIKMLEILLKELHDAKIKMVNAINGDDKEMASKYQEVVHDLEKSLKLLEK